jgi:signal peptidase I
VDNPVEGGGPVFRAGAKQSSAGAGVVQKGGQEASPRPSAPPRQRRQAVQWAVVVLVALVAAVLVRMFVVEGFSIPSGSMEPTLIPGDRVFVEKLASDFRTVHDGDIVVFRRPPSDHSNVDYLIKRVVAGPGQWLSVSGCRVYVNGKPEPQPYLPKGWQEPGSEYCTQWDVPAMLNLPDPYRVPAGTYFVMGDNRKDSDDSRYWGPVPANYVVGGAFARVWPPSRVGLL